VLGTDGLTYDNECYARAAGVDVVSGQMNGLGDFLSSIASVGDAATNIVADPCLLQVSQLINSLHTGGAATTDGTTSGDGQPGIGLCSAVTPLTFIVWASQNPVLTALGAAAFLGLFVGVGYKLGKKSKSP
jgi:hypothetical protein